MIHRSFDLDPQITKNLTEEEQTLIKSLAEIVSDIARVYEVQQSEGFYPKSISKESVELAAKQDKEILSPFTIVTEENGSLKSVPYHTYYATYLEPIALKIEQAALLTTNEKLKRYLNSRAKSLRDDSYNEADSEWLLLDDSPIDFSIGPFERYIDTVLFLKRSFQGHVGIIDEALTREAEQIKQTLYSSAQHSPNGNHSTDIPKKGVQLIVEHTPTTSGYSSQVLFSGEHFPSDLTTMQEHGAKIVIYYTQMVYKFEKLHYPIFEAIFEKTFASKYSKEALLRATFHTTLLYELGRQLHKFPGARGRLKELYGVIDEGNGFVSGIQHCKYLVMKGLLNQEELEAIIIMHIVWMFSDWLHYQKDKSMQNYVMGNAIPFNTYLETGALKQQDGISWPNFSKMFFEIEALAEQMVNILQNGTYEEAQAYIKQNAILGNFAEMDKNLRQISVEI